MTVSSGSLSGGSVQEYIAAELLILAEKSVVFQQIGEKAQMPSGAGKTYQFNRYNRLPLPRAPLAEGVPPVSNNLDLTTVQATADQWGAYIALTDVAVLTIQHPLLAISIQLLAMQAAELIDRNIIDVLQQGTSVTYGGSATANSGLTTVSTDSLTDLVVQKVVARLRKRGATTYEGTKYLGVIDPAMEQDVTTAANSAFVQASAYSNQMALYNGEIGTWRGVRWMVSNFIPTLTGVAAASYTTPTSPVGTFAAANYRVTTAYYDANTGMLAQLTQNAAVTFAAADSLGAALPADANYVYKIFVGLASGGATDIMYQGVDSTYGTGFMPASAASVILAPPTSGASIAGSYIPAAAAVVHFGWVFGKQSYCVVDLQNLQTFVSKNEATPDNPLVQIRTVGYKFMHKPVIQNNDFMERIDVLSAFN